MFFPQPLNPVRVYTRPKGILMPRPYVTRLVTDIKRGADVNLGWRTLIVGRKGSGKSTITQALELALSQSASDIAGRDVVKLPAMLAALAPNRASSLRAQAMLSTGEEATFALHFRADGKKKRASKKDPDGNVVRLPACVNPDRCFPLRAALPELTGSVERAREFLLNVAGRAPAWEEVLQTVQDAEIREALREAGAGFDRYPSDERVVKVRDLFAQKLAEVRAANAAPNTSAQVAAEIIGAPPSVREMAEATARVEQLAAEHTACSARLAAQEQWRAVGPVRVSLAQRQDRLTALQSEFGQLREKRQDLESRLAEARAAVPPMPTPHPQHQLRAAAHAAVREAVTAGIDNCPVCLTAVGPKTLHEIHERANAAMARITEEANAHVQAMALVGSIQVQLDDLLAHGNRLMDSARLLEAEIHSLQAQLANTPAEEPAPVDPVEYARVRDAHLAAINDLKVLERRKEQWVGVNKVAAGSTLARKTDELRYETYLAATEQVVKALANGAVEAFVVAVQHNLPISARFDLRLVDEYGRETAEFGLLRGEPPVLHSALSGGEWAQVCSAIADVLAPPEGVSVVIPPDVDMDDDARAEMLMGFAGCSSQVIVTATSMPTEVPAGWTLIQLP